MQVEGLEGVEILRCAEVGENDFWLDGDGKAVNKGSDYKAISGPRFIVEPAEGFTFVYRPMFGFFQVFENIEPKIAVLRKSVSTELETKELCEFAKRSGFDLTFE